MTSASCLESHRWRADVLSGLQPALPEYTDRQPEQLREAAEHFQEVAKLHTSADAKRGMVKAGIACRARADAIEAHYARQGQTQCASAAGASAAGASTAGASSSEASPSMAHVATYAY